jgi:hypothetical protein
MFLANEREKRKSIVIFENKNVYDIPHQFSFFHFIILDLTQHILFVLLMLFPRCPEYNLSTLLKACSPRSISMHHCEEFINRIVKWKGIVEERKELQKEELEDSFYFKINDHHEIKVKYIPVVRDEYENSLKGGETYILWLEIGLELESADIEFNLLTPNPTHENLKDEDGNKRTVDYGITPSVYFNRFRNDYSDICEKYNKVFQV